MNLCILDEKFKKIFRNWKCFDYIPNDYEITRWDFSLPHEVSNAKAK